MKLVLNLSGNVLIFNEDQQATLLQLLSTAKLYRSEGWSDCTYHPADEIPKISFVKNSQIMGLEEFLADAKKQSQEKQSEIYKLQSKNLNTEKQLKELQEKMVALQNAVSGVAKIASPKLAVEELEDF